MLTLDDLCAEMAVTGRYLTPRTARDWWTKGLLPRPRRHGLGRGNGTETFWTEPTVGQPARAAYDLLVAHPRADTAILGLWLQGFPVGLGFIRLAYKRSIRRHFRSVRGRSGRPLDDAVGKLAEMFARQTAKTSAAPAEIQHDITDLALEFLEVFYGLNKGLASSGLAALWERAAPYIGANSSLQDGWIGFHPQDDDLAVLARYLAEMASLTAQRAAVASATDYELIRARRLVLLVFGYLDRLACTAECGEEFEEFGRRLLMTFGSPAVPILIAVLRKDALRTKVVSSLLDVAKMLAQCGHRRVAPAIRAWPEMPDHGDQFASELGARSGHARSGAIVISV